MKTNGDQAAFEDYLAEKKIIATVLTREEYCALAEFQADEAKKLMKSDLKDSIAIHGCLLKAAFYSDMAAICPAGGFQCGTYFDYEAALKIGENYKTAIRHMLSVFNGTYIKAA